MSYDSEIRETMRKMSDQLDTIEECQRNTRSDINDINRELKGNPETGNFGFAQRISRLEEYERNRKKTSAIIGGGSGGIFTFLIHAIRTLIG